MNEIERAFCDADEKILAKVETWIFSMKLIHLGISELLKLEIDIECTQFSLSHPVAPMQLVRNDSYTASRAKVELELELIRAKLDS